MENKSPYIKLIHGVGGWNSCLMTWDHGCGCHTAFQTGENNTSLGDGSREGAVAEAKLWAECEGYELRI